MADFDSRLPTKNLGTYSATNPDPNTTGVIGHVRAATPADTDLTIRITSAKPNFDNIDATTVQAIDINAFNLVWDTTGSNWDRLTGTGGALNVNISSSTGSMAVNVDGVYAAVTNTDPDNIGLISHNRALTPADADQTVRTTAAQPSSDSINKNTVYAIDTNSFNLVWDGTNWNRAIAAGGAGGNKLAVGISDSSGNAFSETNPLPVTITESSGTAINAYNTSVVAAGGTANYDYTVTASKTLYLTMVQATSSGKARAELKVETGVATGVFTTRWVFFNSTAEPNMLWQLREPIAVAAGVRVRVTMDNRDNQSASLYTTITGHEV